jgi:hypothetical protein
MLLSASKVLAKGARSCFPNTMEFDRSKAAAGRHQTRRKRLSKLILDAYLSKGRGTGLVSRGVEIKSLNPEL